MWKLSEQWYNHILLEIADDSGLSPAVLKKKWLVTAGGHQLLYIMIEKCVEWQDLDAKHGIYYLNNIIIINWWLQLLH